MEKPGPPRHDITLYVPRPGECSPGNPYLEEIERLKERPREENRSLPEDLGACRGDLVTKYSFSIPTAGILKSIAARSPLVEIGAGNGYWARCLTRTGADIIAYDKFPPDESLPFPWGRWEEENFWFDSEWFPVNRGDEAAAARHPDRSLFLCWPPFNSPMAGEALELYARAGGRTLLYIGDPLSSGDHRFHERRKGLALLEMHELWHWPGTDDRLWVYGMR